MHRLAEIQQRSYVAPGDFPVVTPAASGRSSKINLLAVRYVLGDPEVPDTFTMLRFGLAPDRGGYIMLSPVRTSLEEFCTSLREYRAIRAYGRGSVATQQRPQQDETLKPPVKALDISYPNRIESPGVTFELTPDSPYGGTVELTSAQRADLLTFMDLSEPSAIARAGDVVVAPDGQAIPIDEPWVVDS